MFRSRIGLLIAGVLLLGLVTSCAGLPAGGAEALAEGTGFLPASFAMQLPPLYLNYEETADGSAEPSVAGIGSSLIEAWFGVDLSSVKIPAFYVDWIKASDIQHLEIVTGPEGIFAYANGKPTPSLTWDAESLALAADLAEAFGVANVATVKSALPWLQRIGLDLVVQMPLAEGAEIIPYRDARTPLETTTAAPEVENPSGVIKLQMAYDGEGVPSFLGLPAAALQPIIGFTPGQLDPQIIARLKQAGVQSLTLQTRGDGLFIFLNDQPLPNVAWSKEHLANALDLYAEMNEASWAPNAGFVNTVRDVVLQTTNLALQLVVNF